MVATKVSEEINLLVLLQTRNATWAYGEMELCSLVALTVAQMQAQKFALCSLSDKGQQQG